MDRKEATLSVLLDLSKAFDSVNHEMLLGKLKCYGVRDKAFDWFESYLKNRITRTRVASRVSLGECFTYGVPQGSVLGPLLFAVYMADLPNVIKFCEIDCYADDTQLSISAKPEEVDSKLCSLQSDLESVSNWMDANYLALNPKKSQFIVFASKQVNKMLPDGLELEVRGQKINRATAVKNLGVYMDEDMSFESHARHVVKAATKAAFSIRRAAKTLPNAVVRELIQALIFPLFDYCNVVYRIPLTAQLSDRLKMAENFAVRLCFGRRKRDSASAIFKEHGWLRSNERAQKQQLITIHRCLNGAVPPYLSRLVEFSVSHAREGDLIPLRPPRLRSEVGRRRFSYTAAVSWNALPAKIKQLQHGAFCSAVVALLTE
jgi:hypothetical protein